MKIKENKLRRILNKNNKKQKIDLMKSQRAKEKRILNNSLQKNNKDKKKEKNN